MSLCTYGTINISAAVQRASMRLTQDLKWEVGSGLQIYHLN